MLLHLMLQSIYPNVPTPKTKAELTQCPILQPAANDAYNNNSKAAAFKQLCAQPTGDLQKSSIYSQTLLFALESSYCPHIV
jgi:aspartyl aminopeptidase